jgi:hypothetical protein
VIDVKVRYNTTCQDNHLFWRILVNGEEQICSNVIFLIPTHTTRDTVWDPGRNQDVDKHHISATANEVIWRGDVVIVR